jgi:hypothetical protein
MTWISISEDVPDPFYEVIVKADLCEDSAQSHFVATYDDEEDEWHQTLTFAGEKAPYISIARPILSSDQWKYID